MKFVKVTPENKHILEDLNHENATILFYLPNCIHCINMRQNWELMKSKLQQQHKKCNIYELNGEDLHDIEHPIKEGIQGFPTLINTKNGKILNHFEKERNIENMMNFVLSNVSNTKNGRNSLKIIKRRGVSFNVNKHNGSLYKKRKVLNAKNLSNSIEVMRKRRKTSTKKKGNKKPTRKNKRGTRKGKH